MSEEQLMLLAMISENKSTVQKGTTFLPNKLRNAVATFTAGNTLL